MRGLLVMVLLLTLAVPCRGTELWQEQTAQVEQAIPEETRELLAQTGDQSFLQRFAAMGAAAWAQQKTRLTEALRASVHTLVLLCLCQLMELSGSAHTGRLIPMTATLGTMACCGPGLLACAERARKALDDLTNFSRVLLPVAASASASAGSPANAASAYGLTLAFSGFLEWSTGAIFLPAIVAFLCFAMVDSALGEPRLEKLGTCVRSLVNRALRLLVYGFTGIMAMTGAVAGSQDAGMLKAMKASLSAAVPVVGGIISDAAGTVLSGAGLLRTSMGTLGMLAILGSAAAPFLYLGGVYLLLKATAALSGVLESSTAEVLEAAAAGVGCLMAIVSSAAYLYLLACVSLIRVVQG